jgi:hypothetical protein
MVSVVGKHVVIEAMLPWSVDEIVDPVAGELSVFAIGSIGHSFKGLSGGEFELTVYLGMDVGEGHAVAVDGLRHRQMGQFVGREKF